MAGMHDPICKRDCPSCLCMTCEWDSYDEEGSCCDESRAKKCPIKRCKRYRKEDDPRESKTNEDK